MVCAYFVLLALKPELKGVWVSEINRGPGKHGMCVLQTVEQVFQAQHFEEFS